MKPQKQENNSTLKHSHNNSHSHSHSHSHVHALSSDGLQRVDKALMLGICLNIIFVLIEFGAGWYYQSLGLMSDAGHNLSDVFSLLLSLIAVRLSRKVATERYTYGYRKSTVLASFINSVLLFVAVGLILFKAIDHLSNPKAVSGIGIIWVASVGIVINFVTVLLLVKEQAGDINIRGAFLHMLADTLVSVGVVLSGIVIYFTDYYAIDSIISIAVAVVIAISAVGVFKSSLRLSLDGVPSNIDINRIREALSSIKGVKDYHHIHIWALSTTETAMTIHIVTDFCTEKQSQPESLEQANAEHASIEQANAEQVHAEHASTEQDNISYLEFMSRVKAEIKEKMKEEGITHVTIEFESEEDICKDRKFS